MSEEINVRFVIPKECVSEDDCCEEMKLAFTGLHNYNDKKLQLPSHIFFEQEYETSKSREYRLMSGMSQACEPHIGGGLQARWVHEKNFTEFNNLTKKDVFVLSQFDGEIFQKLKATKCLLVGPRCLSCSLIEGTPIPQGPGPVFTIAMRGLIITASGLTKTKKENIQQKVHWMGGVYKPELTENTTHLVADNVISDKYIQSVKKGIPIMKESWIEAVWSASLKYNVNGASTDFNEHRLPPFYNLNVTTSGLSRKEKHLITTLVNDNGGIFSGAFQSETTDVVVLTKDSVGSEKYKAALEYGKACVVPAWVKDSAARGVALPMAKYKVLGASTSSPLAEHRLPDMSLNFSRITNSRPPSNFVDETRSVDLTTLSGRGKLSQESKRLSDVDREIISEFEKFDMSCLKKAGPIFDGFCIWVSGLEGLCRERAAACVSRCGGVRYDCAGERVTHAAAGTRAAAAAAARALPAVPVLSALWLLRSAEARESAAGD
ncbi:DNA topoisomerase 2-binding protein 1-B [Papilio machaon]|uniref:DNA topoisomerase 2-binding protein 1-B n=1 Tax=Papilio machaon TaxID=76193 RepID=A0A0N1IA69_PAPMA|nr:DNA topoisomerase 2-binding protein 1-B [Papilio machaon]